MACSLQVAGNDFMRRIRELEQGGAELKFVYRQRNPGGCWEPPEIAELLKTTGEMDFLLF